MNRNALIGLTLVIAAGALGCLCASAKGGLVDGLFGMALWYLPYVALVVGIRRLARAA